MNLGIGFPESVSKTPASLRRLPKKGISVSSRIVATALLMGLFFLLLLALLRLQLLQGPYYRVLSEQNRVKTKIIHAPRGTLYDRNGIALVHNIPGFRQVESFCDLQKACSRVLTREEVLQRKAKGEVIENLEIDSLRQYTKPQVFAHVLGYVSQITEEELADASFRAEGYMLGDQLGRGGVEEQYEEILAGKAGRELIETDAQGMELRLLGKVDPIAGRDLTLALDSRLQETAFDAMVGKTGAVIVANPKTGEILTLLSTPSFDANLFTLGAGANEVGSEIMYKTPEDVLSDEKNRPLFNRAVSGTYPPGSTFKIITAAAALEKGAITKDTKIEDVGVLRIGAFSFANWYFTLRGKTEGFLDVVSALKRSNDIFFYKTAEFTGLSDLRTMGLAFGLSKKLGIDVPGEAEGLFPSDAWKQENIGEPWYIGDTYHLGIGQGYLLTTPLQMNVWTNVIANNGILCQPTVVKTLPAGRQDSECRIKNEKFLKQETIDLIKEGMRQACDVGGTGWPLFKFQISNFKFQIDNKNFFPPVEGTESGKVHIPIACKTGTAEFGDPKNRTHAWFTAYAPIADPEISVTVLIEAGGEGSNVAAPVAKKIFEEWFGR